VEFHETKLNDREEISMTLSGPTNLSTRIEDTGTIQAFYYSISLLQNGFQFDNKSQDYV
ncbi:3303_t:CDS:2, partial [Cetraspora pellucida]